MGRLDGKVAFITGAARGQGRSHAIRMAEEGADIIAVDICEEIETVPYELGTWEELEETAAAVEGLGRRVVIDRADVRDRAALEDVAARGAAELGGISAAVTNAGVWSTAPFVELDDQKYHEVIDVQMHGTFNTCKAVVPLMIEQEKGGSIVIISSTAGLKGYYNQAHYNMAKHAVIGLMRTLCNELAPHFIRVNSIHPSSVITRMIDNPAIRSAFFPEVENPTQEEMAESVASYNALPIPWIEPVDVSNAVVYLTSDESRYVTGVRLPIDAGFMENV
ncbi:MAG: mycofactocin-coupled SDR family oxidoreductase [Actinobacteria bacterium]|nr:mycofactocin-coupled SDR family oxidoreductase [Actinomycetota bacterium]